MKISSGKYKDTRYLLIHNTFPIFRGYRDTFSWPPLPHPSNCKSETPTLHHGCIHRGRALGGEDSSDSACAPRLAPMRTCNTSSVDNLRFVSPQQIYPPSRGSIFAVPSSTSPSVHTFRPPTAPSRACCSAARQG